MVNIKENEELSILNHSCAHVLAQAIKRIYPQAKFWVGPVIESGFYYDIDLQDATVSESDFSNIESVMKQISKEDKYIIRKEITKEEALIEFAGDEYKLDLINNLEDGAIISTYTQNEFTDLCRGPHVASTKLVKFFKLLKVSGAYFKGDNKNKMLTRIYGICFPTLEELNTYLDQIEQAKLRDHKKLGKQLNLFTFSEYGQGLPFYLPQGMILRQNLETYWIHMHQKYDYQFIKTPVILSKELWITSGHYENYKDNMYTFAIEEDEYAIKPMNCPGALLSYKEYQHSYKELPIRFGEMGLVHRHEASGALNGLFRLREFTQDDAHTFILNTQITSEVTSIIKLMDEMYSKFGLEYRICLSTRPLDHYIGTIESWDYAEASLKQALDSIHKPYQINPGDGAFYGPKLDFMVKDSLGRDWQCGTIQLDSNLPERFDINYVDSTGQLQRPLLLHRVVFGSIDRFIGIITEHYAGKFPLWLAPTQIKIIPVNNLYHLNYSHKLLTKLKDKGFRVVLDESDEKLGYKIRKATLEKIPLLLVIGDNEIQNKSVNVRDTHLNTELSLTVSDFIKKYKKDTIL
jgi:threonyl-tRNA synthetase